MLLALLRERTDCSRLARLKENGDLTSQVIAGKYELLRQLGKGGMGVVYEARNIDTLKRCAVKLLLKPELAADAEVTRRFFREARASGLIESEHVVAAYDSGVDATGRLYYVMEYLQGEDLSRLLDRIGSLTPQTALKLVIQVATGLVSAHALGVVHRDIKPANLFLATGAGGEVKVKILDFGVAKVKMEVFGESLNSVTRVEAMLGTPPYMSPEQVKRASAIDASADVWSLGIVLFECLAGKLPWENIETVGEQIAAILMHDVPPLQNPAPWVRPELAAIVQQTLCRDKERRLRSAAELRARLSTMLASDPRLFQSDLRAPSELERSAVEPRFVLDDTLPVGDSAAPAPVTASARPERRSNLSRLSVATAAGIALAASAWFFRPSANHGVPTQVFAQSSVSAAPKPSITVPSLIASFDQPKLALHAYWLEISPPTAKVTIDGAPISAIDGRVQLESAVGSRHLVQLSYAGAKREEHVSVTREGLIPSRIAIRPQRVLRTEHQESRAPQVELNPTAAPAQSSGLTEGLSEKFE